MAAVSPLLNSVSSATGTAASLATLSSRQLPRFTLRQPSELHSVITFSSLLGSQGTSPLLSAATSGLAIVPAGASLMVAAAAVDAAAGAPSADGRVLLAGIQLGVQAVPMGGSRPAGGVVELSVTIDSAARGVSVAYAGSERQQADHSLLQASLLQLVDAPAASVAAAAAAAAADRAAAYELPLWLQQLLVAALNHHALLPSRPSKAQVARRSGSSAPALEPSVAAACQLEASLALPLVTGCTPGLPSSIEGCVLAPRGQGAEEGLDLVDPDAPDQLSQQPVRRSSFWLSAAATGAFAAQVRGVAYRPLAEVAAPAPSAAALGASANVKTAVAEARGVSYKPLLLAAGAQVGAASRAQQLEQEEEEEGDDSQQLLYSVIWQADASPPVGLQQQKEQACVALRPTSRTARTGALATIAALQQAGATALPLQLSTSGGCSSAAASPAAAAAAAPHDPAAAMAWAAARVAANEQPGWRLTAVDDDSSPVPLSLAATASSAAPSPSPQSLYGSAVRGGALFSARLVQQPATTTTPSSVLQSVAATPLPHLNQRQGTCLVTGGSGFLAACVARWLIDVVQVKHVHLVSRSGQLPAELSDLLMLPRQRADADESSSDRRYFMLTASKADTACSSDAAAAVVAGGAASFGLQPAQLPVLGLFHAAGVLADGLLGGLTAGGVRRVVAPKADGLAALRAALTGQPVASTVLFSSVAALLGSPGQANYAAANAALDAAAASMQACGVSAMSVQWGAWAGAGMAASDPQTAARVARLGVGMLRPSQALAALESVMAAPPATSAAAVAAVPIRWSTFLSRLPPAATAVFFSAFAPANAGVHDSSSTAAAPSSSSPPQQGSGAADAALLAKQLRDLVDGAIESVLGAAVAPDTPLMAAGLDSLGAVELRNVLQEALGGGLALPPTFVFDAPTPAAMVAAIQGLLPATTSGAVVVAAQHPSSLPRLPASGSSSGRSSTLAVSGFVSRCAAGSAAPEAAGGGGSVLRDPVGVVPLNRWDVEAAPSSAMAAR